jgi:hypothetical protein
MHRRQDRTRRPVQMVEQSPRVIEHHVEVQVEEESGCHSRSGLLLVRDVLRIQISTRGANRGMSQREEPTVGFGAAAREEHDLVSAIRQGAV